MGIKGPAILGRESVKGAGKMASETFNKDMVSIYPNLFSESNANNLVVFESQGRIITLVGMLPVKISLFGHTLKVGLIGSVCTLSEFRGKGLALSALQFLEEHAIKQEIAVFLISGSGGLYSRFGAVNVNSFALKSLKPQEFRNITFKEAGEQDLSSIMRLYAYNPVRFLRTTERFKKSFLTGYCMDKPAKTFVTDSSYVSVLQEEDETVIVEYGGTLENGKNLASHLASKKGLKEIRMIVDSERRDKGDKRYPLTCMVKVISSENVLNQLNGYFSEFFNFSELKEVVPALAAMGLTELTRALFVTGARNRMPALLPLPVYGWDYI